MCTTFSFKEKCAVMIFNPLCPTMHDVLENLYTSIDWHLDQAYHLAGLDIKHSL